MKPPYNKNSKKTDDNNIRYKTKYANWEFWKAAMEHKFVDIDLFVENDIDKAITLPIDTLTECAIIKLGVVAKSNHSKTTKIGLRKLQKVATEI